MPDVLTIGLPPHLYCLPLIAGLEDDTRFRLHMDVTAKIAIMLRKREIQAAFLSTIDYARESSDYRIIPQIAATSQVANGAIVIHFKEGIRNITRLAVDPASTSEIILARILLAEEFDIEPAIVPVDGSLQMMLQKADAALLVGDTALRASGAHCGTLDLVEAWNDLTNLPYVHGFWCCRERELSHDHVLALQKSKSAGSLRELALRASKSGTLPQSPEVLHEFLQTFSYELTQPVIESIQEFMHYAYYHGILADIGELNFYKSDLGDNPPSSELSPN